MRTKTKGTPSPLSETVLTRLPGCYGLVRFEISSSTTIWQVQKEMRRASSVTLTMTELQRRQWRNTGSR